MIMSSQESPDGEGQQRRDGPFVQVDVEATNGDGHVAQRNPGSKRLAIGIGVKAKVVRGPVERGVSERQWVTEEAPIEKPPRQEDGNAAKSDSAEPAEPGLDPDSVTAKQQPPSDGDGGGDGVQGPGRGYHCEGGPGEADPEGSGGMSREDPRPDRKSTRLNS